MEDDNDSDSGSEALHSSTISRPRSILRMIDESLEFELGSMARDGDVFTSGRLGPGESGRAGSKGDQDEELNELAAKVFDLDPDMHVPLKKFINLFEGSNFSYLSRSSSDHAPMLFTLFKKNIPIVKPFRFLCMWGSHDGFLSLVEQSWGEYVEGCAMVRVSRKLKRLKHVLIKWNREVFGRVEVEINRLENQIRCLEDDLVRNFSLQVEEEMLQAKKAHLQWVNREEMLACQKSRIKWLAEGDSNSKFFHTTMRVKKKNKIVDKMMLEDGRALESAKEVHLEAVQFYQGLFTGSNVSLQEPEWALLSSVVTDAENEVLCRLPSEEEVYRALRSIPMDSSPGPDGFSATFFYLAWDIVKADLVDMAKEVFEGQSIFDNMALAQELVQGLSRKVRGGNVMLKLDMAKAYDRVNWKFLLEASRGVRQGDPLSPYLFILSQELLSRMLHRKFSLGLVKPYHPREGWKSKMLSFGGKILLLRHVLNSMPIHILSVVKVPKAVFGMINKIFSNFLWGSSLGNKKRKWVAWHQICKPMEEGGIGIRDLVEVQQSLFMKFGWKLVTGVSLWADFFREKYLHRDHVYNVMTKNKGSRFWKGIMEVMLRIFQNSQWLIGAGNINFWMDNWLGGGPLKDLCLVVGSEHLQVVEVFDGRGPKLDVLSQLVPSGILQQIVVANVRLRSRADAIIWKNTMDGNFTTKSAWDICRERGDLCEWRRWPWLDKIPKKMSFLCWRVKRGVVPTDDVIQWLGIPLASKCHCCIDSKSETLQHTMCEGLNAQLVWKYFADICQIKLPQIRNWKGMMGFWWRRAAKINQAGWIRGVMPIVISWCLWKARCSARMEGATFQVKDIIRQVKIVIYNMSQNLKNFQVMKRNDCLVMEGLQVPIIPIKKKQVSFVKWELLRGGMMKLNVDGGARGNPGDAGGGGIIRDCSGSCIAGFAHHYGVTRNTVAECRALLDGLRICKNWSEIPPEVTIPSNEASQSNIDIPADMRHTSWNRVDIQNKEELTDHVQCSANRARTSSKVSPLGCLSIPATTVEVGLADRCKSYTAGVFGKGPLHLLNMILLTGPICSDIRSLEVTITADWSRMLNISSANGRLPPLE
ncbi:uncharacterized protein LOC122306346 [Carya illinoinensis]|uniref:uncharacterized protein LOC122306346 n=1 Tax=Carya illinoinensis TaxID=32201 RepID=UPI001C728CD2|nr:uncharacterized protein LOC122306346 [Carya illinoinensis]